MTIDDFLTNQGVRFERLHHRPAYTANRVAQALHVPGREMAKTVLLRTDHGYMVAVLPATHRLDMGRLRQELNGEPVGLASEREMEGLFPDCERGSIPPFGSMYQLPTLVDESLAADEKIVFEAQSHEDAIRMSYRDFSAVEHPQMGCFACRA
jgi:Ala-tRNA(Pro) deacylase